MDKIKLNEVALSLVDSSKGILAADESTGTITKRFNQINIDSNFENRRKYRELLFSTDNLENYISGVILFDETIKQTDQKNQKFVELLNKKKIKVGIKVDGGTIPLAGSTEEKITQGIDGLYERLNDYKTLGAVFTKWRAVISINQNILPTYYCIKLNNHLLGRYAKIVQELGLVPIVEPEILMDGDHSIEKCLEVTSKTLKSLFEELDFQNVYLQGILLKPNMIISGSNSKTQASDQQVADLTVNCLKENVPADVPGIVFLSGGQSNELATQHLNLMNKRKDLPFKLSFSYGRALQQPAISEWKGLDENILNSQNQLFKRSKLNSLAVQGLYNKELEKENL